MARISKYKNEVTDISAELGEKIREKALTMTIADIDILQNKYGISDAQLSDFLSIDRAVMSTYKKKGELPKYYQTSIFLFFYYMEHTFKKNG